MYVWNLLCYNLVLRRRRDFESQPISFELLIRRRHTPAGSYCKRVNFSVFFSLSAKIKTNETKQKYNKRKMTIETMVIKKKPRR